MTCNDGLDNDCDQAIDSADSDCVPPATCPCDGYPGWNVAYFQASIDQGQQVGCYDYGDSTYLEDETSFIGLNYYDYGVGECIYLGYGIGITPADQVPGKNAADRQPVESACHVSRGALTEL